ncbi:MAG: NADH-quinone oxidoreductase subunit C [Candidatus Methanoplasma sp.]|jgi:ech hydrogenase subunit D|nr:NADH-quinone oxidoreductase subunit C [Candidatus Methanoplasma sp.]
MKCHYRIQNFEEIKAEDLTEIIRGFKTEKYRLCQICASNIEGDTELIYSFDLDHELFNIKATVRNGGGMESITGIYQPASIYESEIHDLFGIEFTGSRPNRGGKFFVLSKPTPWLPENEGGE